MMKNLASWLSVLALCVGASAALAAPEDGQAKGDALSSAKCYSTLTEPSGGDKSGKAYTIRVVEKKGAKFSYDLSKTMSIALDFTQEEMEEMDDEQTALAKQDHGYEMVCRVNHEVVEAPNGRFTFSTTVDFSKFKGEGLFGPMVDKARDKMVFPYISTTDDLGGVLEMPREWSSELPLSEPAEFRPHGLPNPKSPIRVGDEWEITYEMPGWPRTKGKAKFVGVETVKGREGLRIDYTLLQFDFTSLGMEGMDMETTSSEWIDPTNGRTLKSESTVTLNYQEHMRVKHVTRSELVD